MQDLDWQCRISLYRGSDANAKGPVPWGCHYHPHGRGPLHTKKRNRDKKRSPAKERMVNLQKRKAPGVAARGESNTQGNDSTPEKLINPETGELVAIATILENGETVLKKGRKRDHFVQMYYYVKDDMGTVRPTPMASVTKLSLPARGAIPILGMGIAWLSNELLADNHRPATYGTLAKLLGVKDWQARCIVRELEENDFLIRYRSLRGKTHFLINPLCFYRGSQECQEAIKEAYQRHRTDKSLDADDINDMRRIVTDIAAREKAKVIPFPF